ncbi:MAG: TIGR03905 family TSCPD domain-containing protein [Lachnospiraceae bacterium]|nr:TIGR03905 family TSCPD domain-containing protein [Lachnospiraceae bacterium]
MNYTYKTSGVCSSEINFDIDGDVISNVKFTGGCNGNLKAIGKLVDGCTVDFIEGKLLGNICGMRNTSCADQLAKAVRKAYNESSAV